LKLLCGYGACDEISGRRHRGLIYLWHRDGPMAANRASSRGFYFGELAAVLLAITLRTCSLSSRCIRRFSFALLLAAAVTMGTFPFAPRWQRGSFELSVPDVGQGDSLFLVFRPATRFWLTPMVHSAIRHIASMTRWSSASNSASVVFFFPATRKNFPGTTYFPNPTLHLGNLTF
jgi:hypothetical protein